MLIALSLNWKLRSATVIGMGEGIDTYEAEAELTRNSTCFAGFVNSSITPRPLDTTYIQPLALGIVILSSLSNA